MATVERQRLSVAELREILDAQTRDKLGLTVDEFLEKCKAETLDLSSPAVSRLAVLGRLLIEASTTK